MIVVYDDGQELIVTTNQKENKTVREFFKNTGRNIEDFERQEFSDFVSFSSRLRFRGGE